MASRMWIGIIALTSASFAFGGSLAPPAGPVAPTPGPEPRIPINTTNTPGDADSVFKITQPGSYYLTGNVTGVAAKHGIEITSAAVTVDLMGFALVGVPGSLDGVSVTAASLIAIEVRNGSVLLWGDEGIDLGTTPSTGSRVEAVRSSGNTGNGIQIGSGGHVETCVAEGNLLNGILTESNCVIVDCIMRDNGTTTSHAGLATGQGCVATRCTAELNAGRGISMEDSATAESCSATSNGSTGIRIGSGSTMRGCVAGLNATGLNCGRLGLIVECTAYENTSSGIFVNADCNVTSCAVYGNDSDGITTAGFGTTIIGCTADGNGSKGIDHDGRGLLLNNSCHFNTDAGIEADDGTRIVGNVCSDNIGPGIRTTSTGNHIESNTCRSNSIGISVQSTRSIVVRNSCASNTTNYSIAADNRYGTILNISAAGAAAVSGSSAAGTLTSTDATANYSY